jgi:predicted amidohydrolase
MKVLIMVDANRNECLRVAAVQMLPATGDREANVQRADRLVREAVLRHGAQLVVLPECALTGYASPACESDDKGAASAEPGKLAASVPGPPVPACGAGERPMTLAETRALAETVPGPSVSHFAALAAELQAYIVWTLPERRGDGFYNSAVLLSPSGELLGTYSKVHINKYEAHVGWTNGDRFFVWPCTARDRAFNLGIMICYDREAARCLTMLGADVIVIPQAAYCTCDIPIHRDQLRVRAYENEVYIAMTNWAGPIFKGHSMIIGPDGEVMKMGGPDEEILTATFDMNALREHRAGGIYGRHHRQPQAYGPLLTRS